MEFPFGVPPNADAGGSEEKVKCRGYGQSDLGKRDLERHFAPVSSQLRTSPRKVKIFSRPTSLYCATSCNRHGKQKSALVEPQCFPPLRLST